MRLLIIDDSPTARMALEEGALEAGYDCVGVPSELEAMAMMEREECQGLLVDAHLHLGVSGIEVGRRFKDRHPTLRVAIVSASSEARLQASARASGFKLLMKPVSRDDLLRAFGRPRRNLAKTPHPSAAAAAEIVVREIALARAGLGDATARDEWCYWAHRIKGIAIMLEQDDLRELAAALERAAPVSPDTLCRHLHALVCKELDRISGKGDQGTGK